MPFIIGEGIIHTRILGTASSDDAGRARQVIIKEMFQEPESVKMLYLRSGSSGQAEVRVIFHYSRGEYTLGHLKDGYKDIVFKNPVRIKSWKITGGYSIKAKDKEKPGETRQIRAYYGINVTIEILNSEAYARKQSESSISTTTATGVHPDKDGIFD